MPFEGSIRLLKDITPNILRRFPDKLLLEYHRKCHMLYASHKPRGSKETIQRIVYWHNMIVSEMLRRGFNHNTPLKT